jgi:hypothetical protein
MEWRSSGEEKGIMRFEISEQIRTRRDQVAIVNALETQLRKVSRKVVRAGDVITASAIEASFGSINRSDRAVLRVEPKGAGCLCVAEVTYRPSVAFWILLVLLLFTYVLWLLPIVFYLTQKKAVRSAVADIFTRVKNEFEMDTASEGPGLDDLEKLAALKQKGILTEAEFETKKREILQNTSYCQHCNKPLERSARFCTSCGAPARPQQLSEAIEPMPAVFCCTCGTRIRNSQGICIRCTEDKREPAASVSTLPSAGNGL